MQCGVEQGDVLVNGGLIEWPPRSHTVDRTLALGRYGLGHSLGSLQFGHEGKMDGVGGFGWARFGDRGRVVS